MKSELVKLVRKLRNEYNRGNKYMDAIPSDIQCAFFDNAYVDSLSTQITVLIEELFGDNAEAVFWFLYEFEPGKIHKGPQLILADGREFTFHTDEDYYHYLETEC